MIILMTMNFDDDEAHGLIVFFLTQLIGVVFLRLLLSGSGVTDSGFLDSLRKEKSSEGDGDQDLDNYEEQRYEKQEKRIENLQATVDAQTELLKAIADKLQIEKR